MSALATESLPVDFDPSTWPKKDPSVWPFVFDPADECDVLEWRDPRNSLGEGLLTPDGHVVPTYEIDPERPWMVRKVEYPDDLLHPVAEVIEMAPAREAEAQEKAEDVAKADEHVCHDRCEYRYVEHGNWGWYYDGHYSRSLQRWEFDGPEDPRERRTDENAREAIYRQKRMAKEAKAKTAPGKVDPKRPAPLRSEVTIDAQGFAAHHRERLLAAGHSVAFVAATGSRTLLGPEDYPEGAKHMDYLAQEKFGLGLLYVHHSLDEGGAPWYQIEPDIRGNLKKDGKEYGKYNESESHRLMAHPVMAARFRQQAYTRLVLAEGSKQHWTMAGLLSDEEDTLALGLAGCTAWSRDKGLTIIEDLDRALRCPTLKDVIVAFDADVKTKRGVHDAAAKLGKQVIAVTGKNPRFLNLPVGSGHGESAGFDDYIGGRYSKDTNR